MCLLIVIETNRIYNERLTSSLPQLSLTHALEQEKSVSLENEDVSKMSVTSSLRGKKGRK